MVIILNPFKPSCIMEINKQLMNPKNYIKKIVLASASPRRKELLRQIGLDFTVEPSDYEESISTTSEHCDYQQNIDFTAESHELARYLSREKARLVAQKHENALVIAADTFILFKGEIMGKPATDIEARRILQRINGEQHSVITGLTVIDTGSNKTASKSVETRVYIRKLTSEEIDTYVKTGEPLDKAGAYAIQGLGAVIVERIEGDYFNVVGLPLSTLAESLKAFGIHIL